MNIWNVNIATKRIKLKLDWINIKLNEKKEMNHLTTTNTIYHVQVMTTKQQLPEKSNILVRKWVIPPRQTPSTQYTIKVFPGIKSFPFALRFVWGAICWGNNYQHSINALIAGGAEITSKEETTQIDPVSMAIYGIGVTLLIKFLTILIKPVVGNLQNLRRWSSVLTVFCYFPEPTKTGLAVKSLNLLNLSFLKPK